MRVLVFALCLAAMPFSPLAGERAVIPVIVDTDPALGIVRDGRPRDIDDGLAIIEAINAPTLDVVGITIVFGNSERDQGVRVARELVRLKGAKITVVPGAASAARGAIPPPVTPAVRFMAGELASRRLTILAIGPLTNIAGLLHHYPERAMNVEAVVAVMGRSVGRSFFIGTYGPVRDFNFAMDPAAAETVLRSGIPVVLAPFELSVQVVVTPEDLERIRRHDTASARYLFEKARDWTAYWMRQFPGDGGFHPWDSAAVAALTRPELLRCEDRGFRVRSVGDTAHGLGDARAGRVAERRLWLETDAGFDGPRLRFCSDFRAGARRRFISNIVGHVH